MKNFIKFIILTFLIFLCLVTFSLFIVSLVYWFEIKDCLLIGVAFALSLSSTFEFILEILFDNF